MARWFAALAAVVMLIAASAAMAHDHMVVPAPQVGTDLASRSVALPLAAATETVVTAWPDQDCADHSCAGRGLCSAVCAMACLAIIADADRPDNRLAAMAIHSAPVGDQLVPTNAAPPTPPPRV